MIYTKTEGGILSYVQSSTSPVPPLVVSSALMLVFVRLLGRGRGLSRRGSICVPLVAVPGLQILVLFTFGQASREPGLLQELGGGGNGHRELC